MDLLEHEGKQLFAEAGLPVLPSLVARTPEEAWRAAEQLGPHVCVKAQAKTGGRGKAGGIRVCGSAAEVEAAATEILALTIRGHAAESLLVERAVDVARELYLAITVSREVRSPLLIFSREGGVDIEELARTSPDAILRRPIDPLLGLLEYQVRDVVDAARFGPDRPGGTGAGKSLAAVCRALWKLYHDRDASLVEVNPLVLTTAGELVCLDSKVTVDENAFFRHPDMVREPPEDAREAMARAAGLAFVPLDGDIGVIGNGAGLVMSTIDQIAASGGRAADFCDIGGGARSEVAQAALEGMFAGPPVAAVLVNIFGGITRCEDVAKGLVEAIKAARVEAPVVVRLDGNAAEESHAMLAAPALPNLTVTPDPDEAVRLVVDIARKPAGGVGTAETALAGAAAVAAEALAEAEAGGGHRGRGPMSILVDKASRIVVQGITGREGAVHTERMLAAGTNVVAGVTPGHGSETVHSVPVHDSVHEAMAGIRAEVAVIFVPAPRARDALFEAADAGAKLIVCMTEGISVRDMAEVMAHLPRRGAKLIGLNCPGLITPARCSAGIMPSEMFMLGAAGVVSQWARSPTRSCTSSRRPASASPPPSAWAATPCTASAPSSAWGCSRPTARPRASRSSARSAAATRSGRRRTSATT